MNLFTPVVDEKLYHPNFKALLEEVWEPERSVIQSWTKDFPDRDNKFLKEFQTTFNSSFWELYLYKLFNIFELKFNWDYNTPDFYLTHKNTSFIVEATSANKGKDERPHEWEAFDKATILDGQKYDEYIKNLNDINKYSIIRLSNGIFSKLKRYKEYYCTLEHVKKKPFVIAIAPYEQPFFYYQYDRSIMALLYNYYVDEEIYFKNHKEFPSGPPTVYLDFVEKDNGSEIELGLFCDDRAKEISAIIFNASATVSKARVDLEGRFGKNTNNWFFPDGSVKVLQNDKELHEDGLFIFHNPYATNPLNMSIFDNKRVCQVTLDIDNNEIKQYFQEKHFISRTSILGRF